MKPPFVIAVDGPAASGKGTVGTQLAREYGLPYLDTGLLYRAVGYLAAQPPPRPGHRDPGHRAVGHRV